jgi:hypothetical protein
VDADDYLCTTADLVATSPWVNMRMDFILGLASARGSGNVLRGLRGR